ncbi:hypothetical protein QTH90_18225 [Variovorax sp. J2P1-59]|uniref:hypothetical protein n=1 Tax=Variovorax flavidus TaxID=3053501 RepID=UPI0025750135|nr:hypothetical protein [Variovorax sp. J2P1-59]MDM0076352.1 hypothetical protein [Variovorax sp. J2P1-59]
MKVESGPVPTGRKPDAFEMRVRFICGALFGLVVGVGLCVSLWPLGVLGLSALVALAVVGCGLGAARFGDRFWARVRWLQPY